MSHDDAHLWYLLSAAPVNTIAILEPEADELYYGESGSACASSPVGPDSVQIKWNKSLVGPG